MSEITERKFDLKEFRTIVMAISTYEDMELLLQHIVEGLCRTFKIKGSSILLYDEAERQLFRVSSYGLSEEYLHKGALYMDEEYEEFQKGETLKYSTLASEPRVKYTEAALKEGISCILSIPIKYKQLSIGLLKIYHQEEILMHSEDMESLNVMMQQLGVVIELNGMKNFIGTIKSAIDQLPGRIIAESSSR